MAGEICPNTADMNTCDKKFRCAFGACKGQSLPSTGDKCQPGYDFRQDYCDCFPRCRPGWGFTTSSGPIQYYTSGCGVGGTFGGSSPYYTPISGSWLNIVVEERTSSCGGYYWAIVGTDCNGVDSTIDVIGCCNSGFNGVASGDLVVTIQSP